MNSPLTPQQLAAALRAAADALEVTKACDHSASLTVYRPAPGGRYVHIRCTACGQTLAYFHARP